MNIGVTGTEIDIGVTNTKNDIDIVDDDDQYEKKSINCFTNLFKKKEKKESLDVIVSSIYEAVLKAQKSIQLNNINRLEYYFEKEGDVYKPKTLKLRLPSKEHSGYDIVDVPLFALVHHNSLNISEFTVKLKANLGGVSKTKPKNLKKSGFETIDSLGKNKYEVFTNITKISGNTANIELKCTISDPPDFIGRMVNRFDRLL
jgi:hypothetical protein